MHRKHPDLHRVPEPYYLARVLHESVGELGDVDEAVLLDAQVHERAARRDVPARPTAPSLTMDKATARNGVEILREVFTLARDEGWTAT